MKKYLLYLSFLCFLMLTVFSGCGKNVETSQTDAQLKEEGKAQLKVVPNSEFARKSIEEAIMEELLSLGSAEGVPAPTYATLSSKALACVKELKLGDREISDLKPFMPLKGLKLRENMISDLSALSGFTKLTQLGLSKNKISDLTPLAGLTQLEELALWDNENIKDLSPLTNLNRLRAIGISKHPNLPESEIDKLKKALPACRIVRDYPK